MRPELPFLATGAVALVGGARKEHAWPRDAPKVIVGTVALVLVASATAGTKVAPLVHAVGLLLLLTATMAAVRSNQSKKVSKQ